MRIDCLSMARRVRFPFVAPNNAAKSTGYSAGFPPRAEKGSIPSGRSNFNAGYGMVLPMGVMTRRRMEKISLSVRDRTVM